MAENFFEKRKEIIDRLYAEHDETIVILLADVLLRSADSDDFMVQVEALKLLYEILENKSQKEV